jgi:hypothetical protein
MPKTALGNVNSWVCGKIRESNKCGALFYGFSGRGEGRRRA